jgi:hypothetical protein
MSSRNTRGDIPLWIHIVGLGLYSGGPRWVAGVIGIVLVWDVPAYTLGLLGGLGVVGGQAIACAVAAPILLFCLSRLAMKELAVSGRVVLGKPISTLTTIVEAYAAWMALTYCIGIADPKAAAGLYAATLLFVALTAWIVRILWLAKRAA